MTQTEGVSNENIVVTQCNLMSMIIPSWFVRTSDNAHMFIFKVKCICFHGPACSDKIYRPRTPTGKAAVNLVESLYQSPCICVSIIYWIMSWSFDHHTYSAFLNRIVLVDKNLTWSVKKERNGLSYLLPHHFMFYFWTIPSFPYSNKINKFS